MLHTRPASAPAPPEAIRQPPPHGPEATYETLRRLGQGAGNRALARRLIQREPATDTRPLELSGGIDTSGRTYRRSEMVRTDAGDPASGRAPSMQEVYWVEFKVNGDGVMTASARTVSPDRSARSPNLRLGTEFGAALTAFKTKGVDVKAFDAEWSFMSDKEMSTNLEVFQNNVKAGKTREQAARTTPSGIIADRAGFKEVSVGATTSEADSEIGTGTYPKVRARFSRPGVGKLPGDPGSGVTGGSDTKGGSGPATQSSGSSHTKGARVTAGLTLAIMGANIAFNWIIEAGNEKRIKQSLGKLEPEMLKDRADSPTMGFLLVFRFSGGRVSADGPSAAARFEGLSYRRAYTESEAMTRWRNESRYEADASYSFKWIDPQVMPSPFELYTPFEKVALAKFADVRKIQFQNVEFAEWGGFGDDGLSTAPRRDPLARDGRGDALPRPAHPRPHLPLRHQPPGHEQGHRRRRAQSRAATSPC